VTRQTANGAYFAPAWLPGGHAQTIYPSLKRTPGIAYRRERVDTPDGDFVDFDWLDATGPAGDATPVVVLFHGLEGNSSSHYALALMRELARIGWRGVVPHFRGCSGEPNRRPRAYHSGDYAEVGWMLATVRKRVPFATLFAAGVSLGGSALLNWLGREQSRAASTVTAAATVSTPLDLNAAGIAIEIGLNRIYSRHFLGTLVPKAIGIAQRFPGLLDLAAIARANSMYAFDEVVTAPLHGFAGTQDYWTRASSKPWLKGIAVPTLVINARNDPYIPASSLPTRDEASDAVTLEQPEQGGHGGFPQLSSSGSSWLSHRLATFFQTS
jgi:predicted alpha/beta-fold hydrolase